MLPVTAPLTSMPLVVQPQLESIRRDNARFEPIPEPTGTGAGSRPRPEADDYDRNRTGLELRDAAKVADGQRPADAGVPASSQAARSDVAGRVDPDGRNNSNPNSQQNPQQQNANPDPRERQQQQQVQAQIAELKGRDREVRAHEAAHASVGGQYAGAPVLQYQKGPDGRRYAVAGEVSIDASTVPDNPQATIRKLETVRAAALAPADPSPQDRQVAARASIMIADARRQLALQARAEADGARASDKSDRADAAGKTGGSSKLASDSAAEAVFGADADLQSPAGAGLTVFPDAQLHSPCPMCSKPHLSPVTSMATLPSNFSLTDRLRTLGVTDFSSRDFRASA